MKKYIRKKPRNSGKTSDLIDMAEFFIKHGRRILIISMNSPMSKRIKTELDSRFPGSRLTECFYGHSNNLDYVFRGIYFNIILVDDIHLFSSEMQETINMNATISNATVLCTTE